MQIKPNCESSYESYVFYKVMIKASVLKFYDALKLLCLVPIATLMNKGLTLLAKA